jgi:hypothetical protein
LTKHDRESRGGLIGLGEKVLGWVAKLVIVILLIALGVVLFVVGSFLLAWAVAIIAATVMVGGMYVFLAFLLIVIPYTIKGIVLLLMLPGHWVPFYAYLPAEVLLIALVLWWRERATANA